MEHLGDLRVGIYYEQNPKSAYHKEKNSRIVLY